MYLDSEGLIVQQNGDGGDTLQREGFWFEGIYLYPSYPSIKGLTPYLQALLDLSTTNGFTRYWQSPYDNPSDTSRDQLVSNIRACGYYKLTSFLKSTFIGVVKNYSRFPNGDLCFINDYGRFIRAFKLWYLWPLLLICDIPLFINALLICFWLARAPSKWQIWLASKASWLYWLVNQYPPNSEGVPQSPYGPTNTSNDINFIGDLAQAQKVYSTPISYLSRKLYVAYRPNYVQDGPILYNGVCFALASYFNAASGANTEFANLWTSIVRDF